MNASASLHAYINARIYAHIYVFMYVIVVVGIDGPPKGEIAEAIESLGVRLWLARAYAI